MRSGRRQARSEVSATWKPLASTAETRLRLDRIEARPARSIYEVATLIVVGLGLLWRTSRFALKFPVWGDEAFIALNVMLRDLGGLLTPLEYGQVAPPGFLISEWLVSRVLGSSEWALRLIPFLSGLASLVLFLKFCRRVADERVTLIAVAIMAASPSLVRHANEVKPYALDLLIALILTMQTWRLLHALDSVRQWLALILTATAGLWFSFPSVFPVAAAGLLLLGRAWRQRRKSALAFGFAYAAITATSWCLLMVLYAGPQMRAASYLRDLETWKDAFPPLQMPWLLPWWLLKVHTGSMMSYPFGGPSFGSTATFILFVVGIAAMLRAGGPLLRLLLAPMLLALLAAALRGYPYGASIRTMLYLAPAICLVAGRGVVVTLRACLPSHLERHGSPALAAALGLSTVAAMIVDVCMPYKSPDDLANRRVARALADSSPAGQRWTVFNGCTPPPNVPDLMLQRWLQQAVELRYNLLRSCPGPIAWESDRIDLGPAAGPTHLIIHRPGWRGFPQARLAAYQSMLVAGLGPPSRVQLYRLGPREDVEVWDFATNATTDRAGVTRIRHGRPVD